MFITHAYGCPFNINKRIQIIALNTADRPFQNNNGSRSNKGGRLLFKNALELRSEID